MKKEALTTTDERRKFKRKEEEYRDLCKKVKTECDKVKERWFEEECQEVESLHQRGNAKSMYKCIHKYIIYYIIIL